MYHTCTGVYRTLLYSGSLLLIVQSVMRVASAVFEYFAERERERERERELRDLQHENDPVSPMFTQLYSSEALKGFL